MSMIDDFYAAMDAFPLVAILRGVRPDEVEAIGDALVDGGFRLIEVPLNSPQPFVSIERLAKRFSGSPVLVGAGTVLDASQVAGIEDVGGQLIISPNYDADVVAETARRSLVSIPGIATPSEAFAAVKAGASALKLFPAEGASPAVLKAMRAVLPKDLRVLPVGGIGPDNCEPWLRAGASGFGLGSALYKPGMSASDVRSRADAFGEALQAAGTI
ncbi:2-dehydro-3-deoxy-6-phosphogalactonate aldolase [Pacificimonas flava]|uniref:2-dehydro-3-deoxyphosphogalactonate aldolase n=1 Tax=Pacificimonas flava TaxID=1234595 RepID=M2T8P0_9SPHN|nr:2-dehydro-3-deoxy-6-phosphogalactonate aldolase [Pacificimonas flava]EMD82849.1 2-dehydro-3-deoxyphosphogalactonate aldolase [Pacificimonas flava]MBB5279464.1 2-dehydro-3-deoxyphosphogalactonate aldolase [Pacificimonas flava]